MGRIEDLEHCLDDVIKEFRGRHLSASEQPTGMGNGWEKQANRWQWQERADKMWEDIVVCISKALGLYIFQGSGIRRFL